MGQFLTSGEAARLLGISKPTVARAVQRGLLRPALVTPGHHRRFLETDLLALRAQLLTSEDEGLELAGQPVAHATHRAAVAAPTAAPEPEPAVTVPE